MPRRALNARPPPSVPHPLPFMVSRPAVFGGPSRTTSRRPRRACPEPAEGGGPAAPNNPSAPSVPGEPVEPRPDVPTNPSPRTRIPRSWGACQTTSRRSYPRLGERQNLSRARRGAPASEPEIGEGSSARAARSYVAAPNLHPLRGERQTPPSPAEFGEGSSGRGLSPTQAAWRHQNDSLPLSPLPFVSI